jgi:hypothetical protein
MRVRPSVFEVWAFATGRKTVTDAAASVTGIRARADAIAAQAVAAFQALDHPLADQPAGQFPVAAESAMATAKAATMPG